MQQLYYNDYCRRIQIINAAYAWQDGCPLCLWAHPFYTGVKAGETVDLDFNQNLTAPTASGLYELWRVVLDGAHFRWEWRRQMEGTEC